MLIKGILDYDGVNYKEPCLTVLFPHCNFKCDKENKCQACQNWSLQFEENYELSYEEIISYFDNPLTSAFCFQGMEPFDSWNDLIGLISYIRKKYQNNKIIIYTGYNKEEKQEERIQLKNFGNIIVKWGRYLNNNTPRYDEVLGVILASSNQYAEEL